MDHEDTRWRQRLVNLRRAHGLLAELDTRDLAGLNVYERNALTHLYDESLADRWLGIIKNAFLPPISRLVAFLEEEQG